MKSFVCVFVRVCLRVVVRALCFSPEMCFFRVFFVCTLRVSFPAWHGARPPGKAPQNGRSDLQPSQSRGAARCHALTRTLSSGGLLTPPGSGGAEEATRRSHPLLTPDATNSQRRQGRVHRQRPSSYHATGSGHRLTLAAPTQRKGQTHNEQN